jgi:GAF domain-containing protein
VDWGIESYLGAPLRSAKGEHLGHLAVFDEQPLPAEPRKLFALRISAARAAAELERLRYEKAILEREERYRDLFDEAPIGYIQKIWIRALSLRTGRRSGCWGSNPTK